MNLETLMFKLLAEAQELFGPRDPRYRVAIEAADISGAKTVSPNPTIASALPECLLIVVPLSCLDNPWHAVYYTSHEVGHVICGPSLGYTTNIEEGACVVHTVDSISRFIMHKDGYCMHSPQPKYWRAEYYVCQLLYHEPRAIRLIRERCPKLSMVDADLICECVPSIDRRLAEKLATEFRGVA